ncbi:hypothetical protein [Mucilaginibacter sp.]|uniref:hypothetical protein n=1 Tax=Mucilaginibacter sp. TaxID=1882438 RepID=UPI0025D0E715|nr:hypothetical protein [Mucilaginibacter sp.]
MKKIVLLIVVTLILSCGSDNELKKILTSQSASGFWILKEKDSLGRYNYNHNQWTFSPDGTSMSYFSKDENKKGDPLLLDMEGSSKSKWYYQSKDSTLEVCWLVNYKVEKFTTDTIFMEGKTTSGSFLLIRTSPCCP